MNEKNVAPHNTKTNKLIGKYALGQEPELVFLVHFAGKMIQYFLKDALFALYQRLCPKEIGLGLAIQ